MKRTIGGLAKRIIFIILLVIGIIVAIAGIVSGDVLIGLGMGAAIVILPTLMGSYLLAVFDFIFGAKKRRAERRRNAQSAEKGEDHGIE